MEKTGFLKRHKDLLLLVFFMFTAVSVMMLPAWLKGEMFIGGGDIKTQWDAFYTLDRRETIDAIRSGKLPFWSWILFLGTNLWASKASYGLFDIFNLITYPIGVSYIYIYTLLTYVKMITAAVLFYAYLRYIGISSKHSLYGGLLYGLSSYSVYYTSEFGFLSFYALLPLYFLGIEKYWKEGKRWLFTLTVFLLFLTNYYLFFAVTVLTPVYFLFRYYLIHDSFKGVVMSALKLILAYLCGFLLSGAFILPVVYFILQNSRVGSSGLVLTYESLKLYLHFLIASFVPGQVYIYGNDVFNHDSHNLKEICFFSSSLVTLLLPQSLRDKKKRIPVLVLYILFALVIFLPPLSSLLNGLSGPSFRWSMVMIFLSITLSMETLDKGGFSKPLFLISAIAVSALVLVSFFLAGGNITEYRVQFIEFLVVIIFLFVYVFALEKGRKYLLPVLMAELCLFAFLFGWRVRGTKIEDYVKARNVIANSSDKNDLMNNLNWLEERNDSSFYRVYVPYESLYWSASRNMNIYYNLPGVMTYDSTYEPSFNEMKYVGNVPTVQIIDWEFSVSDPDLLDFLSVKYAIVPDESEIPFENYEILTTEYRGFLIVAKNTDALPLGKTYSKVLDKDAYDKDPKRLREYVVTSEAEDIKSLIHGSGEASLYDIHYSTNTLQAKIDTDGKSFIVTSIPYDEGWKVTVNGEEVKTYNVNLGFLGFAVPEGHSDVGMYFVPKGFKVGAVSSLLGTIGLVYLLIADRKRRGH